MKKFFTHEVKIAVTAVIAAVLLFFGLSFLKGLNAFSSDCIYYARFSDISGLATGSPILANGYKVGTVKDIDYNFNSNSDIIATLSIDKHLQIPQGSRVELVSEMLGGTKLHIVLDIESRKMYSAGDTLRGGASQGVLDQVSEMVPAIENIIPQLDSILHSINKLVGDPSTQGIVHNTEQLTAQLTASADKLNSIMTKINSSLPAMVDDASNTLDEAHNTMSNVASITQKIDEAGLDRMLADLSTTIADARSLMDKIDEGQGTVGALVNDRKLYDNLNTSVESLDKTLKQAEILVRDLKENPKRYVHFSIFGRKN